MSSIPSQHRYTVEEYLALEESSEERHEFHDGEIFAMAGNTGPHATIVANVVMSFGNALKGTGCRPHDGNIRIGVPKKTKFVYSDVPVVCGPFQYDPRDPTRCTILNPKLIVEVLSKTTEAYDRGRKFAFYRDVGTLREYVLISQREPSVESFFRDEQGQWSFSAVQGLDSHLTLRSMNVKVSVRELYADVVFPTIGADEPEELAPRD